MADFVAVIRRAVDGLAVNSPDMRAKVYDKVRSVVRRQLDNMNPRPPQQMVHRQMEKIEAAINVVESEQHGIMVVGGDFSFPAFGTADDQQSSAEIPTTEIGPDFVLSSHGKLQLAPISFATDLDLNELGQLRSVLSEAADELVSATAGSNTHHHIHLIAKKYRSALGVGRDDLAVDLLFFYGIRLQNAAKRLADAIAIGDLPEGSFGVGEALDSVVSLHGPAVMSTGIGRDLVKKAQGFSSYSDELQRFRTLSRELVEALDKSSLLERGTAEELAALAEGMADGKDVGLSAQAVRISNGNAIAWCARGLRFSGSLAFTAVVAEGVIQSHLGTQSASLTRDVIDHLWNFFEANSVLLSDLAALSFADLQWLPSFMRWLKIKRVDRAAEEALQELTPNI